MTKLDVVASPHETAVKDQRVHRPAERRESIVDGQRQSHSIVCTTIERKRIFGSVAFAPALRFFVIREEAAQLLAAERERRDPTQLLRERLDELTQRRVRVQLFAVAVRPRARRAAEQNDNEEVLRCRACTLGQSYSPRTWQLLALLDVLSQKWCVNR